MSVPLRIEPVRRVAPRLGGEIARVAPDSPAARLGVVPGDWLLAIDGLVIRDLIDYRYQTTGERLRLSLERQGRRFEARVQKRPDEELGLEFSRPVFEGIRECNNGCDFCFIRGLPAGLRSSLYIRDDDYRYSFLFGTFLTLTNLDEADWQRIGYQRLSPLNVSVHATDVPVRRKLLNNRRAPAIVPQLHRLGRLGVQVHTQIVLCAGLNDGAVLERSLEDLVALHPVVQSVSVVPVGLTRFSRVRNVRRPSPEEALAALAVCEAVQARLRRDLGVGVVYPSDELYLLAGRPIPAASAYDGFPVLTNGVGLLRCMLDEWDRLLARRRPAPVARRVAWLSGRLAAPALEAMADRWAAYAGWRPEVRVVTNRFFGEQVTVSGLLAGQDLVDALRALPTDVDDVVLPRSAFGFDGRQTLDGVRAEDVGAAHPGRVHLASTPSELLQALA